MKKWTPGPWKFDELEPDYLGGDGTIYYGHIRGANGDFVVDRSSDPARSTDEADSAQRLADVHLMCAAPDLYEALEEIRPYISAHNPKAHEVVERIDAALRKARGEPVT